MKEQTEFATGLGVVRILMDQSARDCVRVLTAMGSIAVEVLSLDGCRIVKSLDPMRSEFLWHVSVSRYGRPVPWEVAEKIARVLLPMVRRWERYSQESATHLWEQVNSTN